MNRERREIIYSVVIIVFIPLLFALNTLLFTGHLRSNFNNELRRKADLINHVIAESVKQHLQDTKTQDTLGTLIGDIKANHAES